MDDSRLYKGGHVELAELARLEQRVHDGIAQAVVLPLRPGVEHARVVQRREFGCQGLRPRWPCALQGIAETYRRQRRPRRVSGGRTRRDTGPRAASCSSAALGSVGGVDSVHDTSTGWIGYTHPLRVLEPTE